MLDINQPAKAFYDSINNYAKLNRLISEGQTESLYVECKSPQGPMVGGDIKVKLASGLSGFSNTEGGIYIYGVGTSSHTHGGLDVLTQIEPVPSVEDFRRRIENIIPTLTTPSITKFEFKILKKKTNDSAGVLLLFIPRYGVKPIQSVIDSHFYFRSGDDFIKAPYTILEQLFASSNTANLEFIPNTHNYHEDTLEHSFVMIVSNTALGAARFAKFSLNITRDNGMENIKLSDSTWRDVSGLNAGAKIFMYDSSGLIYYGLNLHLGEIRFKLPKGKKKVEIKFSLFADKMVPRFTRLTIHFLAGEMKIVKNESEYISI